MSQTVLEQQKRGRMLMRSNSLQSTAVNGRRMFKYINGRLSRPGPNKTGRNSNNMTKQTTLVQRIQIQIQLNVRTTWPIKKQRQNREIEQTRRMKGEAARRGKKQYENTNENEADSEDDQWWKKDAIAKEERRATFNSFTLHAPAECRAIWMLWSVN